MIAWDPLWPREVEVLVEEVLASPLDNILHDDEIGQQVAHRDRIPVLRVWRHLPVTGLVVSRRDVGGQAGQQAVARMASEGWPLFVRSTGGTAVPHGEGMLNLSLIFPRQAEGATTDRYYRILCQPLVEWLRALGLAAEMTDVPGAYCDGNYNVAIGGRKVVGTAQAWRGGLAGMSSRHPGYVLAHGCISISPDLDAAIAAIQRFYRYAERDDVRVERDKATTLAEASGEPWTSAEAKDSLVEFLLHRLPEVGVTPRFSP
ncbi:MAG: lipoate--protein ligase family protein [Alicyclobacillus mali]|uniref:lipoate--protein ligase family protein n=1 Tax=Alicyclobacillus mali (ex Roth et al. 2021) TaxID=1123961 RepID=UPI000833FAF3|nr:lipoate--protein ligase family protein [Alicyclobacillus mali (ex Roth et al. 2021)]MCL6488621.1 lipoate--protein ligase family protein [Alicyclobacillus mali (ex Roth et al. 2021)]